MTLASGATINVDAGEITAMLADETAGRLTIGDQAITVTGAITVDNSEPTWSNNNRKSNSNNSHNRDNYRISDIERRRRNQCIDNRYQISADATGATAAQLNAINDATSVAVDLTNVTALAASSQSDLETLATAITNNEFKMIQV